MAKIEITMIIDGKLWSQWETDQPSTPQLHERLSNAIKLELERHAADQTTVDNIAKALKGEYDRHTKR